jgi:NAD(P)H-dependent FMN reductase
MIAVISGTNRGGSRSIKVAQLLVDTYARLGVEARLLDLVTLPLEIFRPDAYDVDVPAFVSGFVEPVLAAKGLHIIVPEYNGSFPGVLKVFIDMLPWPDAFQDRPVAFVGLSNGRTGALRAVEHLQMVYAYRNAYLYPRRVFMPAIKGLLDEQGLLIDPDLTERLNAQASGFVTFIHQVSPGAQGEL